MATTTYSADELVNFAVKIEEQGIAFYKAMAQKTKNQEVKALYLSLAIDEEQHRKRYQALLSKVQKGSAPGEYPEEYQGYLRALVENTVFPSSTKQKEALANDGDVLDFAIDREKDSILFYLEMRDHLPKICSDIVETIINEERKHIVKLLDHKEKLG